MNEDTKHDDLTLEDLQGRSMGEALSGNVGSRSITVVLSEDDFKRIGGTQSDLERLSRKLSDFTNDYVRDI